MTDAQYEAWLRDYDGAQPVALYNFTVGRGGVETPRKLSRLRYDGAPYEACIERGLVTSERITREGVARMAAGRIIIGNFDGARDAWLDDDWENREFEVLVGDLRWPLSDFRVEFRGTVETCVAGEDEETLEILTLDRMTRLDVSISEAKFADGTYKPVALGEAVNVTPKWDEATQSWVYHCGPAAGLVAGEARVEARPRTTVTQAPATGSFKFQTDAKGAVTCSVWGDATGGIYRNTIGSLARMIATGAGRFTEADIDTANFDAFEAANPQPVGRYLTDRESCARAIAALASSVQAQLLPSLLGKLRLVQWRLPTVSTATIRIADYATIKRGTPLPVAAAVRLAYCRNYTPQTNIQATIPDAHRALLAEPWRYVGAVRAAARTRFKLQDDPLTAIETAFTGQASALAEVERRADEMAVKRVPFILDAYPQALLHTIGQEVTIYGDRYNLLNGKLGQITAREVDFDTMHVLTEITVK